MRNRFPGTCYRCGQNVEPFSGHFEKIVGAGRYGPRWRTQHAECAIAYRGLSDRSGALERPKSIEHAVKIERKRLQDDRDASHRA